MRVENRDAFARAGLVRWFQCRTMHGVEARWGKRASFKSPVVQTSILLRAAEGRNTRVAVPSYFYSFIHLPVLSILRRFGLPGSSVIILAGDNGDLRARSNTEHLKFTSNAVRACFTKSEFRPVVVHGLFDFFYYKDLAISINFKRGEELRKFYTESCTICTRKN